MESDAHDKAADGVRYPEHGLYGRSKVVHDWIPAGTMRLLDAGCAYGHGTRFFARRSVETLGLDPNPFLIDIARARYSDVAFELSNIESTPFEDASFDVVVMADVLEHVRDERATLSEVHRILRPAGSLIITVPNRGLFSFLDIDNVVIAFKKMAPRFYGLLYRVKERQRYQHKAGYETWHRHYSYSDLIASLQDSAFRDHFVVQATQRWGLIIEPLMSYVIQGTRISLGLRVSDRFRRRFEQIQRWEDCVRCGPLSYNLALHVRKKLSQSPCKR